VAARLKLSNKARKRLGAAAASNLSDDPYQRAYRIGIEGAVDTLLLEGRHDAAVAISGWNVPRLPIGGGELIAKGVPQGPEVAKALRRIEDEWVAAGFPSGDAFERWLVPRLT
jgi:poly(A) polymerase